ncbi:MAG: toll/interleukin-1 receptor domain-containing protein [Acidobacteriota bacterium]
MDSEVYKLAKEFFGFGHRPKEIKIFVPGKERPRNTFTLQCANYPLFDHYVFPDDLYSAMRVYSLLERSYPGKVEVAFAYKLPKLPDCHRVLIGGPPTNPFANAATRNCPIHFDPDPEIRILHGANKRKYEIDFQDDRIREDYCLISKRTVNKKIEFVIAGLRAYGQMGVDLFLGQEEFYERLRNIPWNKDFQVLVKVEVTQNAVSDWRIVSPERFDAFLCHSGHDQKRVLQIANRLENQGLSVWRYQVQRKPTLPVVTKIHQALNNSKYLVACLSPSFLNSPWCLHELESRIHEQINTGSSRVIVLGIETLDPQRLPQYVRHMDRLSTKDQGWFDDLLKSLKE